MKINVQHIASSAHVRLKSPRQASRDRLKRRIAFKTLETPRTYANKDELDITDHRDTSFLAEQWAAEAREARELERRGGPGDTTRGFYYDGH